MAGFYFRLEHGRDAGSPARPAYGGTELERRRHDSARPGGELRVIETRFLDEDLVLVVERA